MDVCLLKASIKDAENLWQMQVEAFADLLLKYQDYDTNPANEQLVKTIDRLSMPETYYYFIIADSAVSGAVRVVDAKDKITPKNIVSFHNARIPRQRNSAESHSGGRRNPRL